MVLNGTPHDDHPPLLRAWRRALPGRMTPDVLKHVLRNDARLRALERRCDAVQEALGRIEARQCRAAGAATLRDWEFRVFSQWNEDGILQGLIARVPVERAAFVEFGVESYQEANTRFLLVNDGWEGLVLDGDAAHVAQIRAMREHWTHPLRAARAFVTRENVNDVIAAHGMRGPIGVLSIDVDGMDYWIWEALDVVDPAIVVIEYNHRLGRDEAVVVPYDPAFERRRAHPSLCWYGASLPALCALGRRKGYAFVGCESHGVNAFFVKRDRLGALRELTAREGFVAGRFREAHDAAGERLDVTPEQERELIRGLPLVRVPEDS